MIDEAVKKLFEGADDWTLLAHMLFGGMGFEPDAKGKEDIAAHMKAFG